MAGAGRSWFAYGLLFLGAYGLFFVLGRPASLPVAGTIVQSPEAVLSPVSRQSTVEYVSTRAAQVHRPEERSDVQYAGTPLVGSEQSAAIAADLVEAQENPEQQALIAETVSGASSADRMRAIGRLRNLSPTPAAIDALAIAARADPEARNRLLAITALANLARQPEHSGTVRSILQGFVSDADQRVVRASRQALERLGTGE